MLISRTRAHSIASVRMLLAALLLAATLVGLPGPSTAIAAPSADDHEQTLAFLSHLLDEINARRALAGTQPLTAAPATASTALDGFFALTLPELAWPGPCVHHLVDGESSWSYVQAAGFDGELRGEVLACPGPEEPYWTPGRTADEWWASPAHFEVLYGDPDANAIACSAAGVQGTSGGRGRNRGGSRTGEAASAVMCVTFYDLHASSDPRVESAPALEPEPTPEWHGDAGEDVLATTEDEPADAWEAESGDEQAWEAEAGEDAAAVEDDASATIEAETDEAGAGDEPVTDPMTAEEAEPRPERSLDPEAVETAEFAVSDPN